MAPSPTEQIISLISLSAAGLVCLSALVVVVSLRISASFQKPGIGASENAHTADLNSLEGDMVPLPAFLVGSLKGLSFPRALFPLISMLWLLAEFLGLNVFALGRVADSDSLGSNVDITVETQRSLCRVSLFVAHGIGEPGVAWATVFITRLALSGHESYMSRRKRLKRELLGWLGPNVVYQALIASIASTDATNGVPKYVGEVVRINDSCNNDADRCAVCSFPLLSLAGSILFVMIFLVYFTRVCIEVKKTAVNRHLKSKVFELQIIGSLVFPLIITFKGITLVSEPRAPLFEVFSMINILAVSVTTTILALILVLRPIFEASVAHKAAAVGWKPTTAAAAATTGVSQGREENAMVMTVPPNYSYSAGDDDIIRRKTKEKEEEEEEEEDKDKDEDNERDEEKGQRDNGKEKLAIAYPLQPVRRQKTRSLVEMSDLHRSSIAEDVNTIGDAAPLPLSSSFRSMSRYKRKSYSDDADRSP